VEAPYSGDELSKQTTRAPQGPLRIVAIGGGTGLSALLHGLKKYAHPPRLVENGTGFPSSVDITAVVTVTDDGGSSGRLRREFDVLPPGDIRGCLVSLSEDEALLSRLFQYRFAAGRGLKGHSFGNLFLTALTDVTGDFAQAVRLSSEVLSIAGRIFPSTAANVSLEATLADGRVVAGETLISRSNARIQQVRLRPGSIRPLPETLEAIAEADLITLGPGSLYTSVVPNLLVEGVPDAIRASHALKAYFVNLMWQPGETIGYTASEHVEAISRHAGGNILDCVVVNTRAMRKKLLEHYARLGVGPVTNDLNRLAGMGLNIMARDLLEETKVIRHNPELTAAAALTLAGEGRRKRLAGAVKRRRAIGA
jgi:uncharacterized cofD-like protein